MNYVGILVNETKLNENAFEYVYSSVVIGKYEGSKFICNDGCTYKTLNDMKTNYDITYKVGYIVSENELKERYGVTSIIEAMYKYADDFKNYLHYGILENNKLRLESFKTSDVNLIKDDNEKLNYVTNNIDTILRLNDITKTKQYLKKLKQDIQTKQKFDDKIITKVEKQKEVFDDVLEHSMQKLNNMVGLENIKKQVKTLKAVLVRDAKLKGYVKTKERNNNMIFTGNPGTGKTTVAEILAEILYSLGYLEKNTVALIGTHDLIDNKVGGTAVKTKKLIDKYRGGVIIIDEAYTLAGKGNLFDQDVLGVLLPEMTKPGTVFIFAGYEKEMENFLALNPGLCSRIQHKFNFKDYTLDELLAIFNNLLKEASIDSNNKLKIDPVAYEYLKELISEEMKQEYFGNGRYISNLYSRIEEKMAINTEYETDINRLLTIMPEDIPRPQTNVIAKAKTKTIGFVPKR